MFLVKNRRLGRDNFVFTQKDPRTDGYIGDVIEDVTLDYDMNAVYSWREGEASPNPQLGRDPQNRKRYRVFKFPQELEAAGYELIHSNTPFVVFSWSDYRKQYCPKPEEYASDMTQDEWFDFLDEADIATRIRKEKSNHYEPPLGNDRDKVAEWVAKRHMGADGGIQEGGEEPRSGAGRQQRQQALDGRRQPAWSGRMAMHGIPR